MTGLATLTEWMEPFGPFGWGMAFLVGATFVAVISRLLSGTRMQRQRIKEAQAAVSHGRANPLDIEFSRQLISIPDFYTRDYVPHSNKEFKNCVVQGPGSLTFQGFLVINGGEFRHCQIVLIDPSIKIYGVTAFRNSTFRDCTFSNLTFYMTPESYDDMPAGVTKYVRMINAK